MYGVVGTSTVKGVIQIDFWLWISLRFNLLHLNHCIEGMSRYKYILVRNFIIHNSLYGELWQKFGSPNIALYHISIIWIYKKTRRPFRKYQVGTMFYIIRLILYLGVCFVVKVKYLGWQKGRDTLFQKSRDWYHIVAIWLTRLSFSIAFVIQIVRTITMYQINASPSVSRVVDGLNICFE